MGKDLHKEDIAAGLRRLGVRAGAKLMVHSSMKSFGATVLGGPSTVIEALMEVLTEQGTLMMPSFNHGAAFEPGGPGHYDPLVTATTNGIIPQTFWRMPGVYRSIHPTHAFAAWGRNAKQYVELHHRTLTFGPDSPLGRLYRDGGHCLFIGVSHGANSFQHVVEMMGGAPCLGKRTVQHPVRLPDGRTVLGRTWGWRGNAPCPYQGDWVDELATHEIHTTVGQSTLTLYPLHEGFEVIAKYLHCDTCPVRPQQNADTVETDWDGERHELKPDSIAHTY